MRIVKAWRRTNCVLVGTFEDEINRLEKRIAALEKLTRQDNLRIATLEQENASLEERLQALEETVNAPKPPD
jgi:prefoldin subunit 5